MSKVAVVVRAALAVGMLGAMRHARAAYAPLPVHMLLPGFTVRELPVKMTNLNNVEYAPDGRLFAVSYDGKVYILTDTDGDGLEDKVQSFYNPKATELRAPVGMAIAPEGIYVASKGRISLLRDDNHDGVADGCEMVAGGWKELFVSVDSLGVAIDKDNNLFFGRGCLDFTNAFQVDKKTGKANYSLKQEEGTIQKLSPDRKTRRTVATGIRFSVGMQINRLGDLFCTDQEGATWLEGGNPLDELLHIEQGKHYGFPFRHPQYLPDVIDEPAVVTFGPQHQSSCGFRFNEQRPGRKPFGPAAWENQAIVTGESRGKLWRCPLVKTPAGYVGKPVLFACLDMLTIDLTISPQGDLVVCCHSGPPDWGTGPTGKGRIFKISYTDKSAPQAVAAYAAGPEEVRVAFDKPIDPAVLATPKVIVAGQYVRAADRMETMKPPYKVVTEQAQTVTRAIEAKGQKLADEGRTLVLSTEKLPWRAWYSVAVPGVKAVGAEGTGQTVDVDLALNGATAELAGDGGGEFSLPHLAASVSEAWEGQSADYQRFQKAVSRGGDLKLRTMLDIPARQLTVRLAANARFTARCKGAEASAVPGKGLVTVTLQTDASAGPVALEVDLKVGGEPLALEASYHTDADPTERPIRREQLLLPWVAELPGAPKSPPATRPSDPVPPGDWARGKALFFGEAKCATCHTQDPEKTALGPNLGNLVHRERGTVMRDIVQPSASINPDYISYKVKLKSGQTIAGLVHAEGGERLAVVEGVDKATTVNRGDVVSLTPDSVSIMPEGFKDLGQEKLDDLLTYLTSPPPEK
jgi:putative heme-binding domain-containing protein